MPTTTLARAGQKVAVAESPPDKEVGGPIAVPLGVPLAVPEVPAKIEPILLTIPDVAALLGVGESTAHKLVRENRIASVQISANRIGITRAAVDDFVSRGGIAAGDPVLDWLAAATMRAPGAVCPMADFYVSYELYCSERDLEPLTIMALEGAIRRYCKFCSPGRRHDAKWGPYGVRCLLGIGLKSIVASPS